MAAPRLAENPREDFDRLSPLIARALMYSGGTHDVEDVWRAIDEGKAQMWVAPRSIVVTEIHVAPKCKTVHWWLAGGVMEELQAMEPGILAWAKTQGCTRATLAGRKGWERSFATRAWTPILSVLERAIP